MKIDKKMKVLTWPKYRSLTTPGVNKGAKQQAFSFIAGGHAKQRGHFGGVTKPKHTFTI